MDVFGFPHSEKQNHTLGVRIHLFTFFALIPPKSYISHLTHIIHSGHIEEHTIFT